MPVTVLDEVRAPQTRGAASHLTNQMRCALGRGVCLWRGKTTVPVQSRYHHLIGCRDQHLPLGAFLLEGRGAWELQRVTDSLRAGEGYLLPMQSVWFPGGEHICSASSEQQDRDSKSYPGGGMHQQDVHVAQTLPVPILERAGAESDESAGGKRIPHRAAHSETPDSENLPVTEKYHNNSKTYLAGHRVMTSVTYQWHTTAWLYLQCRMVWVLSGSAGRNA